MWLIARNSLLLLTFFTLLTGVVYPLLITGIAYVAFPTAAGGSLLHKQDTLVGSALIGQEFHSTKYFWGRPSFTADAPYNAAASAGENRGPANMAMLEEVMARIAMLKKAHPAQTGIVPMDLVVASASGLDPHISVAAAEYQLARVAKARHTTESEVRALLNQYTEADALSRTQYVNVLTLNLALDAMTQKVTLP